MDNREELIWYGQPKARKVTAAGCILCVLRIIFTAFSLFWITSLCIPIVMLFLILNWFFKITSFQRMEGATIILPIFTSPVGFVLGLVVLNKLHKKSAKLALILNGALFFLPFLYFTVGTILLGP